MTYRERAVRGSVASDHIVQLFDSTDSFGRSIAQFVEEGVARGEQVLLVLRPEHWQFARTRLAERGVDVDAAVASMQIIVRDAAGTLQQFMRSGVPDPERFDNTVGRLVRHSARGPHLRVYGEMVDLLAAEADFRGARELEGLWNGVAEAVRFTLFCGYHSEYFGDPRSVDALRLICRAHSHVRSQSTDDLGSYLVSLTGSIEPAAGHGIS